jgi:DNA-binding CsgD family transcriptional regulator
MAEDLAPRISSLLTGLGPVPQQNIHAIVSKICELLSCDGAVYARFEAGSDTLCIRSACNLPHHPVPARSPIHDLLREVIATGVAGPVCAVDPAVGKNKSAAAADPWLAFQSFIGQQVLVGGLSPGALAALDMRRRVFTDPERLLIGLAARALALEEARLQIEELLSHRLRLERAVAEKTTALREADTRCTREIESHKCTIATLTEREAELAEKSKTFEELNTTLAVLLKRRENDLGDLEERMVRNIRDLLDPAIKHLKSGALTDTQQRWLDVLASNLNELASPFSGKITSAYRRLTPMEIMVASFIKHSKNNKEISDFLGISSRTVEVHRSNIRCKLGIKNRKQNLRTFLMSIE